jgi:hypothetical protein
MAQATSTTDHDTIRQWVEERGGQPATVADTQQGNEEAGLLRIDFPDHGEDAELEAISWDAFFEKFDEENLAFLYQEETDDGETSRFCRFVSKPR